MKVRIEVDNDYQGKCKYYNQNLKGKTLLGFFNKPYQQKAIGYNTSPPIENQL